ncbi:hypothetical protein LXL04_009499 [Taraxacum kok-saghyz]
MAEEIANGDTLFNCSAPIRDKSNNEKLWEAMMATGISSSTILTESPTLSPFCFWFHQFDFPFEILKIWHLKVGMMKLIYLWIHQGLILLPFSRVEEGASKIVFKVQTYCKKVMESVIGGIMELLNLRIHPFVSKSRTTISFNGNQDWYGKQGEMVKKVVSSMPVHFQVSYKKHMTTHDSSLIICSSEVFYVPRRLVNDFKDLVNLVGNLDIHQKVAIPMFFLAMDSTENFDYVKKTTMNSNHVSSQTPSNLCFFLTAAAPLQ